MQPLLLAFYHITQRAQGVKAPSKKSEDFSKFIFYIAIQRLGSPEGGGGNIELGKEMSIQGKEIDIIQM